MENLVKYSSPTGINYYEYNILKLKFTSRKGFRPLQGLTITNENSSVVW